MHDLLVPLVARCMVAGARQVKWIVYTAVKTDELDVMRLEPERLEQFLEYVSLLEETARLRPMLSIALGTLGEIWRKLGKFSSICASQTSNVARERTCLLSK